MQAAKELQRNLAADNAGLVYVWKVWCSTVTAHQMVCGDLAAWCARPASLIYVRCYQHAARDVLQQTAISAGSKCGPESSVGALCLYMPTILSTHRSQALLPVRQPSVCVFGCVQRCIAH